MTSIGHELSVIRGPDLATEAGLGALTLSGFIREVCSANGEREALNFRTQDGQVLRISYAQLWQEAMRTARALVACGVGKNTRVGVLATNRPEWIYTSFGIALCGGTAVALSSFATLAELEQQLRLADVSMVLFERAVPGRDFGAHLLTLCPELEHSAPGELRCVRLPYLRRAVCLDAAGQARGIESRAQFLAHGDAIPAELVEAMAAEIAPADVAMIFFSSGSTGQPKGIVHSHRAASLQCWRWAGIFGIDRDVRTWAANGFFWSGNFAMALGATFAAGGCLVLQRYFDPGEALRLMAAEKVTLPLAWPHQWARLASDPAYAEVDLGSLRYVGEASPLRRHPTVHTDWHEPVSAYGNTETLTLVTMYPSSAPVALGEGNHGPAMPGNTLRILDVMSGQIVPMGQTGEIAVKGPTLMLGYLKTPAEKAFDEDGYFRTGDGGFVDADGRLHWQGRLNDIIKTGGANVSPLEIDAVLAEYPGIKVAKTVGVAHETLGEMVVACVVGEPGAQLKESSIREFVGGRLSSYKVPRRVLFLQESDLSLTGTNKVKTADLRALAAQRLAPPAAG